MKYYILLFILFVCTSAYAAPQRAILIDGSEQAFGTSANPIVVTGVNIDAGAVNSGTQGNIPYYATTGEIVSPTNNIYFDGTNLGIGTSTPDTLLTVNGQAKFIGSGGVTLDSGSAIRTAANTGNTALFQAYDTDGVAYTTFATLTAGTTPTFDISSSTTIGSDTIVSRTGAQTLTNKTLTTPVISTISNTGTITLPTSTDTLVGRATTDTLTNKTLTSPKIGGSGFLDLAGNTAIGISTTTTAVNYITISNQATGTDPGITVTGDANRGLTLTNAGTGGLTIVSTNTGPSTIKRGLTVNNDSNSGSGDDFIVKTTSDATALVVDASTNNIGIGTAVSPSKLYVVGTGTFTTGLNIGIGTASPTRLCIANNAVAVCP